MVMQRNDADILDDLRNGVITVEQAISQLTSLIRREGLSQDEAAEIAQGLVRGAGARAQPGPIAEQPERPGGTGATIENLATAISEGTLQGDPTGPAAVAADVAEDLTPEQTLSQSEGGRGQLFSQFLGQSQPGLNPFLRGIAQRGFGGREASFLLREALNPEFSASGESIPSNFLSFLQANKGLPSAQGFSQMFEQLAPIFNREDINTLTEGERSARLSFLPTPSGSQGRAEDVIGASVASQVNPFFRRFLPQVLDNIFSGFANQEGAGSELFPAFLQGNIPGLRRPF